MPITIHDIAKKANVSIATVSRVINQTKDVSTELKERVYLAIEESGFKPNALARGLVTKKTNMIGIIVPDISNPIFGTLTKGINSVCQKNGYALMMCESGGVQERELELIDLLSAKRIDGLLFAGVDVNNDLVTRMKAEDFPVLLVTQEASGGDGLLPTVAHDNIQAVYDAVNFLITNGHRRIALIMGSRNDYSSGKKRLIGYRKALEEHGIEVPESYIEYGDFSFDSGYRCMKTIYEENHDLPTAVMACNDLMAMGAIRFLRSANFRVPDDMSVMGFDDLQLLAYFTPELSTVRISYYEEGKRVAKDLFQLLRGKKDRGSAETYYEPHKIIRRKSVKNIAL